MNNRFAKTAVMLALTALSTTALAQGRLLETEPPGRVGRVALAQGKVSISSGVGDTATAALVNWPVTTRNLITTEPNGRAEVRIGSTAIRVDGDSSLEVTELDDDSLRLRLHYGSASVRILSEDVLPEFELVTPHAQVRMRQPGRLRVDAERVRDTSVVSVFDGAAQVTGGGASLTVRAGRSAELRDDDVRTLQAQRDDFDDWSLARDRAVDGARSARYVSTDMTGYEELDRHGSWHEDVEYGALWTPRVASSWVPYRDGRWTWIAPWGWTWVDNASWGYAPFHYGRWVQVRNRWAWAPGHVGRRPVWAPALVGWVGSGWSASFSTHGSRPATGWYPLGPHDYFVPGYRLSDERLRRLNDWRERDGWRRDRHHERRDRGDRAGRPDYRQRGLTVVPQANFGGRGPVVVSNLPQGTPSPQAVPATPGVAPAGPQRWRGRDRDRDGIPDRIGHDRDDDGMVDRADRDGRERDRFERRQRPPVLTTDPAPQPVQPGVLVTVPMPSAAVAVPPRPPAWQRFERGDERDERTGRERGERGDRFGDRRERQQPAAMPHMPAQRPMPVQAQPQMQAQPQPQPQMQAQAQPQPQMQAQPQPQPRAMPEAPPPRPLPERGRPEARSPAEQRGMREE
ncbi:DUF6600 domain-containing protein [Massilia sp. H6]|uniref:DUF6600 domain-containing protein n=1 Tax=Massilia sp. H6 TaxID=2970464 RepID=UPI002169A775|nr:DUF6600 domain-containing protein [Massilia sp. H6]UVW28744.1 hypothetical protein NRS07_00910 [Massilia sp. H6]